MSKRLLDDRVLGSIIVASVLLPVLILYEGEAVTDVERQSGLASDARTLLAARDSLEVGETLNWTADTPIEIWDGVRIAGSPRRVTRLSLNDRRLAGTIPSQLGDLAKLTQLDFRDNQLRGQIPSELADLAGLTHLYLDGNMLTGAIPSELGNLAELTNLWLSHNQLTGGIPSELGGLAKLERLRLSGGNLLTGCVPAGLQEVPDSDLSELNLDPCEGS